MVEGFFDIFNNELNDVQINLKKILLDDVEFLESSLRSPIEYLLLKSGKKVRPCLIFLIARALHGNLVEKYSDQLLTLAIAIELIHTASLVHDDIIDNALVRRDQPTLNIEWGNSVAVTVGTYLYAKALALISSLKSFSILNSLSQTISEMCKGELLQLEQRKHFQVDLDRYYQIIHAKTVTLFSSSVSCTEYLFNENATMILADYGRCLGFLFQITDDYLDVFDTKNVLKKQPFQDWKQGQVTLPIVKLYQELSDLEKKDLVMNLGNMDYIPTLQYLLKEKNIAQYLLSSLKSYYNQSLMNLEKIQDSNYKTLLIKLVDAIYFRVMN